ncbi:MAG TPA: phosphatase RsbU N-terminal domain-containing protein, partial [Chloroflexota bacterium]|nr:phosphatase RsbU N-terminal domain-containing protein [Chloroflexota bacterium]
MRRQNFNDEFDELLRAFLISEDETELYKASEFGRRLVDRGIGPDELVAAHLEAVQRILHELPPKRVPEAVVKAHNLLLEAVMAYSLAYHEYTQAEQRRYQQARLYSERLEAREKELRAIIDSIQEGLVLLDRDGEVRLANLAGLRLFAQPSEKVNGQILNGSSLLSADQHFAEAIRQLRQNPSHAIEWETAWNKRQWQISLVPVHAEESELIGTLVLTRDVTDRQQIEAARAQVIREQAARAEMEASHRRLSVLASASALMASSFDYESTLKDVARLVVSDLADYCLIYLIDTSGESRLVAASHADEEQKSALEQFAQDSLADLCNPRSIVAKVFQTRKSEFIAGLPGSPDAQASDSEQRKARRVFEPYRMIAAPLLARERVLGVILLGASDPAKALSPAEILLAEELGQRAALAIENARLYQEAQEALAKLQATQQQIIQQERLRALGEMASGIAHDFNNALAQIIGFIEILLK